MIVFSEQSFWLALAVIWLSLACLLYCADLLCRGASVPSGGTPQPWLALSMHAGWVSLVAFVNTAQVIVAFRLLPRPRSPGAQTCVLVGVSAMSSGTMFLERWNSQTPR